MMACPVPCSTIPQMQMDSALGSSSQRSWRAQWQPRMSSSAVSATPIPSSRLPTCLLLPRLLGTSHPRCSGDFQGTPHTIVGLCLSCCELCSSLITPHWTPFLLPGGWALNMKDLKLLQTIGKGEFGGEQEELGALRGAEGLWGVWE